MVAQHQHKEELVRLAQKGNLTRLFNIT